YDSEEEKTHFAAVGTVATRWAYFELMIDRSSLELAQINMRNGSCITSQVAGHSRKLDAYISLAREIKNTSYLKELEELAKDATSIAERRNRTVHDPWLVTAEHGPTRFESTARRKLRYQVIPGATAQLEKLVLDIDRLTLHLKRLHRLISAEPNT